MGGPSYASARGSARGGRGDFSWESVRSSEGREHYIGASLHAAAGRWASGRDLTWWNRGAGTPAGGGGAAGEDAVREERRAEKRADERAMREALGLPPLDDGDEGPEEARTGKGTAKDYEVKAMLQRGRTQDEANGALAGERTRGLGVSARVQGVARNDKADVLKAEGWSDDDDDDHHHHQAAAPAAGAPRPATSDGEGDGVHRHRHHRRHHHRHRRHHRDGDDPDRSEERHRHRHHHRRHRSRSPPEHRAAHP